MDSDETRGRPAGPGHATGKTLTLIRDGKIVTLFRYRDFDAYFPNTQCYYEEVNALDDAREKIGGGISKAAFIRLAVREKILRDGGEVPDELEFYEVVAVKDAEGNPVPVEEVTG